MIKFIAYCLLLVTSFSFAATSRPEKLTVALDWFINPAHAPLVIAKQQGFFKAQGLEVELLNPADPNDPPKWAAAGKVDIAITYQPDFLEQVDQGLPLVRVGTLIDKPLNCLVVLKDSNIKTLTDLKGKQIGTSNAGLTDILLKVMLKKAGLAEQDIHLVNVHYNLTQALLSRKVDAVSGLMRNFEVAELEKNGHHVMAYFPEEYGVPNYSELIFITRSNQAHDTRIPRFLTAIKQAVAYLDQHPRETWQQFSKAYPEANNDVNHEAWFATMPYFAEEPANFDAKEWQRFADFMRKNQLIKRVQPLPSYVLASN